LLPSDLTFAKESRDLLIDCCVEFIHLVSSEANEICERETKKTISADHVVKALVELGFEDYVQEIQEIAVEHKEQQKVSSHSAFHVFWTDANREYQVREKKQNKLHQSGMSQEELQRMQEELLGQSRAKFEQTQHREEE
jgi:down-regulator of transcription 1